MQPDSLVLPENPPKRSPWRCWAAAMAAAMAAPPLPPPHSGMPYWRFSFRINAILSTYVDCVSFRPAKSICEQHQHCESD